MSFRPISIDKYVKMHLKSNPSENEMDLRRRLNAALEDYKMGIKCACGNDIWVIGSASTGNSCFTCITGESFPYDDFELDSAITKRAGNSGRRHIDDIPRDKIAGFFDDDGYEINIDLIRKPSLCLTCIKDDIPHEEMLCNMTRYDQKDDIEFRCFAFKKR
jgi:hypothetical protein